MEGHHTCLCPVEAEGESDPVASLGLGLYRDGTPPGFPVYCIFSFLEEEWETQLINIFLECNTSSSLFKKSHCFVSVFRSLANKSFIVNKMCLRRIICDCCHQNTISLSICYNWQYIKNQAVFSCFIGVMFNKFLMLITHFWQFKLLMRLVTKRIYVYNYTCLFFLCYI